MNASYDALIVVSFGGPEGQDEVIPFLENVLRGKNVPRERMLEVAEHYRHFGGVSPINAQNRDLIAAIEQDLSQQGIELPVYWGNRNWHPLLPDTLRKMKEDGVERALAFVTSAFSSYSGCRQYREDIERARMEVGVGVPEVHKLRPFFNHPGFIEAVAARVQEALEQVPESRRAATQLVFTAHSIPLGMAQGCDYEIQLQDASQLVAEQVGARSWKLVYQSRSGPPSQPWLDPDVCDYLESLDDVQDVVLVPLGFISDHMEVLFDLDTEARELCERKGIHMVRAATAGVHPRFIRMITQLIAERLEREPTRPAVGSLPPRPDFCPIGCCARGERPRR